jgi:hypothetical protein
MTNAMTSAESRPENIDFYYLRDDLARSYCPANSHERMILTNTAECWLRLTRARDAERRFFEGRDLLAILESDMAKYKVLTKYVNECERAWRASIREMERTLKRRLESIGSGRRRRPPVPVYPPDNWDLTPVQASPEPVESARRE